MANGRAVRSPVARHLQGIGKRLPLDPGLTETIQQQKEPPVRLIAIL